MTACSGWRATKNAAVVVGVVALLATSCGAAKSTGAANSTGSANPTGSATSTPSVTVAPSGPLTAPATSPVEDAQYFTDLSQADHDLATYMQSYGNVAMRALLTDGAAFCAFLQRGGGIDTAMSSLVIGANSVESQTHLPASVTTYNAIDSVSLLTLCPAEQSLIPPAARTEISQLATALGTPSG